jgi:hypothetical protein
MEIQYSIAGQDISYFYYSRHRVTMFSISIPVQKYRFFHPEPL